jgi:type III secretory pathway component EscV
MDASKEPLGNIEVVVGLNPSLECVVRANDFRARLEQYLDDLLVDLRLPACIELSTMLCQEPDRFPVNRTLYQVRIAGRPCRLELQARTAETISAEQLSQAVARDIYYNRDLILTPALCEAIRERWLSEKDGRCFRAMSAEKFQEMLSLLVQWGSRVDRAREMDQETSKIEGDWSIERKFEAIVDSSTATAIRVLLSKTQYERRQTTETSPQLTADTQSFRKMLDELDDGLFYDLGIILPEITVGIDERLAEMEVRFQFNDLRLAPIGVLNHDQFGPAGVVDLSLRRELKRNAGLFLTTKVVECKLDLLRDTLPALAHATLERFDLQTLTLIMRYLLQEEISILNLRALLESILAIPVGVLSSRVEVRKDDPFNAAYYSIWQRADFKRYITHKYSRGNTLIVYLLASHLEARIAESDREPLTEDEHCRLLQSLVSVVEELSAIAGAPVILTTLEARRKLRRLVEKELPSLAILAYQELSPDVNIQPVGRLDLTLAPAS